MFNLRYPCLFAVLLLAGCGPPDIVYHKVPLAPDIALYGGVCFESMDGMQNYKTIVILPDKLRAELTIVVGDGQAVKPDEFSRALLDARGVKYEVSGDDGQGSCRVLSDGGMHVFFESHRAVRISLYEPTSTPSEFAINLKGHQVRVPVSRAELESMLGKPDAIKLDTFAEEAQ